MWFSFGRQERFGSQFEAKHYPVTVDVLEVGIIYCFVLLALCFYVVLPGRRGLKFVSLGTRVTVSLLLGLLILLGQFGQEWEVGYLKQVKVPYKAGPHNIINASVGIKIGFRSVNVTLESDTRGTNLTNETVNYNERFEWGWDQGRFGFGPYAGLLQREFREAQYKGLPIPILWIVDYFVFDGEGLRFGRFYRTSGWYCHLLLWFAFPCWVLANVFYVSILRYGNFYLAVSGFLQLTACLVWAVVKNPLPLKIIFDGGILETKFGSSFYLTLIGGLSSIFLASLVYILDLIWPDETAEFFNINPLSAYDEVYLSREEAQQIRSKSKKEKDTIAMAEMGPSEVSPEEDNNDKGVVFMRRRTLNRFARKSIYPKNSRDELRAPSYSNLNEIREDADVPMLPPRQVPKLPPRRF